MGIDVGGGVGIHAQFFQPLGNGPRNQRRCQVGVGSQQGALCRIGR